MRDVDLLSLFLDGLLKRRILVQSSVILRDTRLTLRFVLCFCFVERQQTQVIFLKIYC